MARALKQASSCPEGLTYAAQIGIVVADPGARTLRLISPTPPYVTSTLGPTEMVHLTTLPGGRFAGSDSRSHYLAATGPDLAFSILAGSPTARGYSDGIPGAF